MVKNIYTDLINNIEASAELFNFFLSDDSYLNAEDHRKSFPDEVYKRLEVSQMAMLLSIYKEECMNKNGSKSFTSKVDEDYLETTITGIAPKDKDGHFNIGGFRYDSYLEVLDVIRNKLAHGDYAIFEDKIVFGEKGIYSSGDKYSTIPINKICELVEALQVNEFFSNKTCGLETAVMCDCKNIVEIKNKDTFRKACDNVYIVEFNDKPIGNIKRDGKYAGLLSSYIKMFSEDIQQTFPNQNKDTMPNYIMKLHNRNKQVLKDNGINLEIKVSRLSSNKNLNKIYKIYCDKPNTEFLKEVDISLNDAKEKNFARLLNIAQLSQSFVDIDFESLSLKNGFLNNYYETENLIAQKKVRDCLTRVWTYPDDITISSLLVCYYNIFQFGLENTYSSAANTTLNDIIYGNAFDFSQLDLSILDDPNMKIIVSFKDMFDQYASKQKEFDKAKKDYESKKKNKENYIKNAKKIDDNKINNFDIAIEEAKIKFNKLDHEMQAADLFMKNQQKFVRNYNILLNLRDSIAHGNYDLININTPNEDTLNDRVLIFNNIFGSNCNYHKEIKFKEFQKIMSSSNVKPILDFLKFNEAKINDYNDNLKNQEEISNIHFIVK